MYARPTAGCGTANCAQPCSQCAQRNTCANSVAPDAPATSTSPVLVYLAIAAVAYAVGKS